MVREYDKKETVCQAGRLFFIMTPFISHSDLVGREMIMGFPVLVSHKQKAWC